VSGLFAAVRPRGAVRDVAEAKRVEASPVAVMRGRIEM